MVVLKQIIRDTVLLNGNDNTHASSISSKLEIAHFVCHKLKQASMSLQKLHLVAIQSRDQSIYIYCCSKSKEHDARKYDCSHCIHSKNNKTPLYQGFRVCCYINKEIMTEKLIVLLYRNALCCGR